MADQNISQTTTSSTIPDWAQGYFTGDKGIFPQAQALAQQQYQAYTGDRQAGMSGLTTQAIQGAGAMTPSTLTTLGGGIAGSAALNAGNMNYQGFQPGQFTGQAASQYMNPFMQNVVDIQQREAQRQADIAGTQRGAGAVKAGAFGGSRQAVMDAEAARNLAIQKGDIQAQGLNQAFTQAQNQFNTEQQLAEQARQYGAGLGLQGLQTAIQGAGQLGTLGQQSFTQGMDINKLQSQYGSQQQAMEQAKLDQQYQDFLTQQQYPYQQLGFYTDILGSGLRGASGVTTQASQMYAPPPSTVSQLAGLGTAAIGLGGLFGKAKGGSVNYAKGGAVGYATGGISGLNPMELDAATDKMSDSQMQNAMGLASITDLAKLQIAQKMAQNNQIRQAAAQAQAAQQQQPQGSIADEALAELGVGALDVPDEMFSAAGGGIVAFATGGTSLRGLEAEAGIPYGTESEFEKRRKKLQESRTRSMAKKAEDDMLSPQVEARPLTTKAPAAPTQKATSVAEYEAMLSSEALKDAQYQAGELAKGAAEGKVVASQQELDAYRTSQEALGQRGTEREASLREQKDELKGKGEKNVSMALLEAGLAMMSGNSQYALENIGKGALVGTKAFKEGEERIQARRDKLDDALYALEDSRFSDKKLDAATERELKRKAADAKTELQKAIADQFEKVNVNAPQAATAKAVDLYAADRLAAANNEAAMARAKVQADASRAKEDPAEAMLREIAALEKAGKPEEAEALRAQLAKNQQARYAGYGPAQQRADIALEAAVNNDPNVKAALQDLEIANFNKKDTAALAAAQAALEKAKIAAKARFERAGGASGTGGASGAGAVPQQAIDALKKNPALAAQFDAKYGVGASAKYLGR